jgi:hypothetical protein
MALEGSQQGLAEWNSQTKWLDMKLGRQIPEMILWGMTTESSTSRRLGIHESWRERRANQK